MCNFANDNKRPIMVKDKVAYWTDIADYDLKTAEAMRQTGRWLYVAFMCTMTPQVCRQLIDDTKQLMTWIIEQLSAVTKP